MEFFDIGDPINMGDYNGLVYLLRKFKRLNTSLTLGALSLESDYGTFSFDKALTSVGGNFIIEEEVNISSSDCLRNCFYSFVFNVIDVNTSGIVNKRQVKVTGGTGDDGVLFVTLPTDLIGSDEVILPQFELDIVFDEHEYYTPVVDAIDVTLVCDKYYVGVGETATVTATLKDRDGNVLADTPCNFVVNGVAYSKTTDSDGQAEYQYTGTGVSSKIDIRVVTTRLTIYDSVMTATVTGGSVILGGDMIATEENILIDWGDGTTTTRPSGVSYRSSHTYTDGLNEHTITFIGEITNLGSCFYECTGLTSINIPNTVTSLGYGCFVSCTGLISVSIPNSVTSLGDGCFERCTALTSVTIPSSVTSLGDWCFYNCTGLTSVTIPNSVENIGIYCFNGCTALIDYQLYWKDSAIIEYVSNKMPVQSNTYFTIPHNQSSQYTAKNYPSSKLTERASTKTDTILSISSNKSSYYTDESITITGALVDENDNPLTSTSVKIYQNNVLLDTLTTDSDGEFTKTLTGLSVGAYTFKAVYDGDSTYEASTSSNLNITVKNHTYSLSIASDKQSILTTESVTISGQLLKDSSAFTGQSVVLYDGATIVDTLTTDGSGNYSKTISGLSVGVHTFKAVNTNAESSTISITVNEPTHEYSLSIQSDKQSMLTTESAIISGVYSVDGTGVSGETITIYDGSTSLGTATTTNGGAYTKTISNLAVGTHTIKASHTNVDSTTVSISVTEPVHDYALSVASTKDILSYADSESATITATLTDNGSAVADETLSYTVKHGSTTIDSGSDTTDSNGEISFSYTATGIGDVDIEVSYSSLLQEIFVIQDCFYNSAMTSSDNHWTIPSSAGVSYSSDVMKLQGSSFTDCYLEVPITVPSTIEFDLIDYTGANPYQMYFFNSTKTDRKFQIYRSDASYTIVDYYNSSSNRTYYTIPKGSHVKIQFNSNSVELYVDDTLILTKSNYSMVSPFIFGVATGGSRSTTYKNIKVKAL